MRISRWLLVIVALVSMTGGIRAQAAGPLAPLDFLIGRWDAIPDASGSLGTCTFALSLQDQVIVRTNHADTAAVAGRPASKHDDLMVIYVEGKMLKADYYDNESHVIRYRLQSRGPNDVVFQSEATASEPGYRLSYVLQSDGTVTGQFEFAQPGEPDAWSAYLSWGMRKMRTIK
jgi:hypothetical protein